MGGCVSVFCARARQAKARLFDVLSHIGNLSNLQATVSGRGKKRCSESIRNIPIDGIARLACPSGMPGTKRATEPSRRPKDFWWLAARGRDSDLGRPWGTDFGHAFSASGAWGLHVTASLLRWRCCLPVGWTMPHGSHTRPFAFHQLGFSSSAATSMRQNQENQTESPREVERALQHPIRKYTMVI